MLATDLLKTACSLDHCKSNPENTSKTTQKHQLVSAIPILQLPVEKTVQELPVLLSSGTEIENSFGKEPICSRDDSHINNSYDSDVTPFTSPL